MSKIYVVSDTHFGHKNIIKFSGRPYDNVEEMDADMIERWNRVVQPEDTVWHLGDFSWYDKNKSRKILEQLNGTINLIRGNHDQKWIGDIGFNQVSQYEEININGSYVVLFHYPILDWNGQYHGSYHLYGHVHGNRQMDNTRSLDCGVDVIGFQPKLINDILVDLSKIEKPKGNKDRARTENVDSETN